VKDLVDQLRRQGLLKHIGGEYPIVTVTADGDRALADGRPIELVLPACAKADRAADRRASSDAGSQPDEPAASVLETLRIFQETKSVEAVAAQRELFASTIYFHLARLIELGLLDCVQVVPAARQQPIRDAAKSVGTRQLKPIKESLGDEFSYEEIRCVVAAIRAERRDRQRERVKTQPADSNRQQPDVPDDIREYLQALHPRKLTGNWDAGFAVDFTGRFTGGHYQRTTAGELLYQFKYRHDPQPATELGELLCRVVQQSPPLSTAEVIVIVPPTQARADFEPVARLAQELGRRTGLPVEPEAIVRARATKHQKEMTNRAQKLTNVRGAFRVGNKAVIAGKRVLLLDDFYDSGATLTEATRVLRSRGAAAVLVLTVGKTIHRA
jgi:predicted amidophosphoribosyltransferase